MTSFSFLFMTVYLHHVGHPWSTIKYSTPVPITLENGSSAAFLHTAVSRLPGRYEQMISLEVVQSPLDLFLGFRPSQPKSHESTNVCNFDLRNVEMLLSLFLKRPRERRTARSR